MVALRKYALLPAHQPLPTPEQQRDDSWLNSAPATVQQRSSEIEELVHREISLHFAACNEAPMQIRLNPLSIFQMQDNRWHYFTFLIEGCIAGIPVIPDAYVPLNEVRCVGRDDTQVAMKAVLRQG